MNNREEFFLLQLSPKCHLLKETLKKMNELCLLLAMYSLSQLRCQVCEFVL